MMERTGLDSGHTVLEAGRGDEALRLCRDSTRPIDLLLTDVVMPQMSGPELSRKLLELRPGTKVVCCPARAGRAREGRLAQRTFRVPRTTGVSGSMTKRMRGRSVSDVETLAEIGVVSRIAAPFHAAASKWLTRARPRAAVCSV